MFGNYNTYRTAGATRAQAAKVALHPVTNAAGNAYHAAAGMADDAILRARMFGHDAADFATNLPNNAFRAAASVPISAAGYVMRNPIQTALGVGTIAGGYALNNALGDPIGGAIQSVGNVINPTSEWDGQPGNPTQLQGYSNLDGTGDNLYRQQLDDSMWAAEKAARLKQGLALAAADQAYNQELGLQTNKLQAEREMQAQQLAAAQANQLLNGYINMIQSAGDRASAAASTRF